jgi:hypothetical protein
MSSRAPPVLYILMAAIAAVPGQPMAGDLDSATLHQVQKTIRDATCAEALAGSLPNRPDGYPLSDVFELGSAPRTMFHVSPEGRDTWSGTRAKPDPKGTDGPFLSIERAREAARKSGPSMIAMGGGDYYLNRPVIFDARDAGLMITARCNETPVLHGGPRVSGWMSQGNGRWSASLKLLQDQQVSALFVKGFPQTQARHPDAPSDGDPRKGWLFAAKCQSDGDGWQGNMRFCFHEGDVPRLTQTAGLVAHIVGGYHPGSQWGSDTLPVTSIDDANNMVHTLGTSYFFTAEGSRYFLVGAPSFLDAPGEWWHDPGSDKLDYVAADEQFSGTDVVSAVLPTFFRLDNADDMIVSGLRFADGAPQGSGKVATDGRGFGAIRLEHADRVRLVGNILDNVGVGIHVSESEDVVIAGNVIADAAGNGIYVGTTYGKFGKSNGARILSNHIHDIGKIYFETAGIWFQACDGIRISDNLIEDTAQFGIAGGSLWGPEDAVHDAIIEHNVVRNANQQTADGGGIKMMGAQADPLNSSIRYNVVTGTGQLMNRSDGTFWPAGYENIGEWPSPISWAIYMDGRASGVDIEGNTLSSNIAAIGINGGWNNVVRGNVISNGSGAAFRVDDGTGREWHPAWASPNVIEENIVSIEREDGIAAYVYAPYHGATYVKFARNSYRGHLTDSSFRVHPGTMPSGEVGGLGDLQKTGMDIGSTFEGSEEPRTPR